MAPLVERITEIPALQLGEAPHWDVATQTLYLVDLLGKYIHKYVPSTGEHTKVVMGKHKLNIFLHIFINILL